MKNINYYTNNELFLVIIIFYLLTRFLFYKAGIITDPVMILNMWQILDLNLLKNHFLSSIYYLHIQPPLWNFIIGLMVNFFGADYSLIPTIIFFFNIIVSIISIWFFLKICRIFKINNYQIFLTSLIFIILSLSYLFYENYTHYTHLTTLIFLLFIYNYLKFSINFELKYELYIYIVATSLVYLWSAYSHPLFICLIFFTILINKYTQKILRSFLIFIIFFFIAAAIGIKNKAEVNYFGNSTWLGFQLIQVLHKWDVDERLCVFNIKHIKKFENNFIENNINFNNIHPSLTGKLSKWNNVGTIYISKKCTKYAMDIIIKDPINYFNKVKFNFISTHGHYSFDHGFKPKNWDKYFGFLDRIKKNSFTNSLKVRSIQTYYLLMYIFLGVMVIRSLFNISDPIQFKFGKALSSIFLIFLWMIVLTHFFAAYEHERMRHIGHFLHSLFFIILLKEKFNLKKIFLKDYKNIY